MTRMLCRFLGRQAFGVNGLLHVEHPRARFTQTMIPRTVGLITWPCMHAHAFMYVYVFMQGDTTTESVAIITDDAVIGRSSMEHATCRLCINIPALYAIVASRSDTF
jgi:hypothetical protein